MVPPKAPTASARGANAVSRRRVKRKTVFSVRCSVFRKEGKRESTPGLESRISFDRCVFIVIPF
jgi:hypothetical protein